MKSFNAIVIVHEWTTVLERGVTGEGWVDGGGVQLCWTEGGQQKLPNGRKCVANCDMGGGWGMLDWGEGIDNSNWIEKCGQLRTWGCWIRVKGDNTPLDGSARATVRSWGRGRGGGIGDRGLDTTARCSKSDVRTSLVAVYLTGRHRLSPRRWV